MNRPITWDKLFVEMAKLVAMRSKDPATQVGAILVSPDKSKVHYGYNGFCAGIKDTEKRWERPEKYRRVVHGEVGAILHAKEDLTGWTLYITLFPCEDCAKMVIHAGIRRIIYINEPKAESQLGYSKKLLKEAKVKIYKYGEQSWIKICWNKLKSVLNDLTS